MMRCERVCVCVGGGGVDDWLSVAYFELQLNQIYRTCNW